MSSSFCLIQTDVHESSVRYHFRRNDNRLNMELSVSTLGNDLCNSEKLARARRWTERKEDLMTQNFALGLKYGENTAHYSDYWPCLRNTLKSSN